MVTVDDDSNCLDGSSPENAAALLTEWGANAIGVNCSTGPATVLTAIEAMRKGHHTAACGHAQCRHAQGSRRPQYLSLLAGSTWPASPARPSPPGAQVVGGCCGTTPNHIRAMRSAMRAIDAQTRVQTSGAKLEINSETPPAPLGQRSRIGALIEQCAFVTLVEIVPPKGIDCVKEIEGARRPRRSRRPRHQRA